MAKCRAAGCSRRSERREESVFQLCQRHINELFVYVNRKPVWGSDGITTVSRRRYAGARRMFGWVA